MKKFYKLIAFAIPATSLMFSALAYSKQNPGEISEFFKSRDVSEHLWFYGLQFLALGIMHILYEQRIRNTISVVNNNQNSLLDRFKIPSDNNYRTKLIEDASDRLMSCYTMVNLLILVWVFFYTFLCFKEFGLIADFFNILQINNLDIFVNTVIRVFNYLDSVIILILAIFFSAPSDLASVELSFNYRPLLFSFIAIIISVDVLLSLVSSFGPVTELWFTIIGALISAICFLSLFARMDSVFLELRKTYLVFLFLYALFQIFYPFEMINWNGIRAVIEIDNVILYFGSFIKFFGKVIIAYIICSKTFQDRMLVYFCCIFNIVNRGRY